MITDIPPEKMTREKVKELHAKMMSMFVAFTDADFTFMVAYRLGVHEAQPHCVLDDAEKLDFVLRSLSNDDEVSSIAVHVFDRQGVTGGYLDYSQTRTSIMFPDTEVGREADAIISKVYPDLVNYKKTMRLDA